MSMFILTTILRVGISEHLYYSESGIMQINSRKGDFTT